MLVIISTKGIPVSLQLELCLELLGKSCLVSLAYERNYDFCLRINMSRDRGLGAARMEFVSSVCARTGYESETQGERRQVGGG